MLDKRNICSVKFTKLHKCGETELEDNVGGTTISRMLKEAQKENNLSVRQMAEEIGVANTTLHRAMDGSQFPDIQTFIKVANWLGVSPASLINAEVEEVVPDTLAARIAIVLQQEPRLAEVFGEAMERVINEEMDPDTLRDLAAYAAYRLNLEPGGNERWSLREKRW